MAKVRTAFWAAPILALGFLAGCAAAPPPSQADQANLAACTADADAVYKQSNLNALGRTNQNGLLYAPMPDQVFNGQRMGTLDARNNQISDCVQNGNPNNRPATAAIQMPAPQIAGTP